MVSEAANFSGGLIRVRWHSIAYAYLSGRRSEQDVYGWRLGIRDIGFEAILVWLNGRSFNKSGLSVLWKRRLYRFIESRSGCKLNRYLYFCFDSTHYLKVSGREYYILAYIMFRLVIPKLDLVRGVDFITEWASCRLDNRGLSRNSREFERAERGGV
jgi:hypothetical protein